MYYERLAKGFLSVGLWSVTQTVASAISLPVYARLLGAQGFGQFAYYQALLWLAAPVGNLGVYQLLAKTIAERPEDEAHRAAVVRVGARLNLAGVALALGLAALILLPDARQTGTTLVTAALMMCIIADQTVLFSRGVLYGVHREARANLPVAAGAVLSSAAGMGAAAAGWGLAGILLASAGANSLVALTCLASAAPFFGRPAVALLARPRNGPLVRFSLGSGALSLLAIAMFRIDLPLVQALAGSRQAGLYAAAAKGAELVWFVPIALQSLMLQSTAAFWVDGQTERIGVLLNRLARYTALATAPLLLVLAVFAEPILQTYFGADFAAGALALRLMVPGVFCFCLARLVMPAIQARGALKALVAIMLAATFCDVALNLWLTPAWGANGAALASSVAYTLAALLSLRVMHGFGVRPLGRLKALKAGRWLLLWALTALVALPARLLVPQPIVAAVAGSALALAAFGAGALRLGLVKTEEVYRVSRYLPVPLAQPLVGFISFLEPLLLRLEPGRRAA